MAILLGIGCRTLRSDLVSCWYLLLLVLLFFLVACSLQVVPRSPSATQVGYSRCETTSTTSFSSTSSTLLRGLNSLFWGV